MRKTFLPILLFFFFAALFSITYLVSSRGSENNQTKTVTNPAKRISLLAKRPTLGTISVNLYSTANSSVDSSHPTSNYGSSSTIATGWYNAPAPDPLKTHPRKTIHK
ncbi:MAG: hypothetical protein A2126_03670 [Candidatus Woykebacteria bacterium GWB1_45_5]|uniref:Uncharacterized protein n=2 Tax=Candidatus Woykeibacteriota TaxID=1817899 RepID=A0A1G1W088_9BACT|nr:MAG: hypothetical protein A2113_02980 [Candidatus Woykebacteria bacterium GWA1_44_8]OGY23357.1 MAG: hypothetical protein A2126_03670 [Candidatus Woykebacteria bacterium GWB1_45_5]